jgi:transposase-like protein
MYSNEGLTDSQIAERYQVNRTTVYRWRKHYGIEIEVKQIFRARLRGGE